MTDVTVWSADIMVGLDQQRNLFLPRVLLVDPGVGFALRTLRLELADERGELRHAVETRVRAQARATEVELPAFRAPDGAKVDDVLRWCWDIVVEADGSERIRWRRYLETSTRISAEGEIELAGPPATLRSKLEEEGWGPEAPWDARDSERLLLRLVREGTIEASDRDRALALRAITDKTVERILIEWGLLSERDVLALYADVSGCEFVELADHAIDPDARALIPDDIARRFGLMAVGFHDGMLTVATSDPQDRSVLDGVAAVAGMPTYIVVAPRRDVLTALDSLATMSSSEIERLMQTPPGAGDACWAKRNPTFRC